ncbi:M48 family metallopeptidase [Wohlfahrtiimonas sp. G9077]|uniref:M48 family metallopeptidase n=1 Tax=Wohlfahrtiimonas sp. G9077 TaxID=1980118 RepID=UPI000B983F70|nr:SprT family zinc-dependent metalloprotease [Wohlfahrtiimonas sp. G9077]OYQ75119.1 metal-dependent hydrolase [Wohlfahrtiimonas sp. G9077]
MQQDAVRPLSIQYSHHLITFKRVAKQSPSRTIIIKVTPNQEVIVCAPSDASDQSVCASVQQRARWIFKQLRSFQAQQEFVTPRQYISGESHYYLGRQYMLKIIEDPIQRSSVKLLRGQLMITVRQKNPEIIQKLLNEWYRARAHLIFHERLNAMLAKTLWVDALPHLKLLAMQTQWGNCSIKGHLTLNPNLIKAPKECIDYVILHELCHIAEHNHSEQFYRLMHQVMPQWEAVKTRLDKMADYIL